MSTVDDFFTQSEELNNCSCNVLKKADKDFLFQYKPVKRGLGLYCFLFEMPEKINPDSHNRLPPYSTFLAFLKKSFPDIYNNSIFLNVLGCRPKNGKVENSIETFSHCYNTNVLPVLKKLNPMAIFPIGRALYSLTGDTFLSKEPEADVTAEFYKPLIDYKQLTKFYYPKTKSVVFPLPKLARFCNNSYERKFNNVTSQYDLVKGAVTMLDKFETEFVKRQLMIASGTVNAYKEKGNFGEWQPTLYKIENKDIEKGIKHLTESKKPYLFLDTETSGKNKFISTNPLACKLICIQVSLDNKKGYFFEYRKQDNELWSKLFKSKKVIIHGALFDLRVLRHQGMEVYCFFDTMIGFHNGIDSNLRAGLKPLAYRYTFWGGYENDLDLWKKKYNCQDYGKIPKDILFKYATMDVVVLATVFKAIYPICIERSNKLITEIAMPFVEPIISIQDHPFPFRADINREIFAKFSYRKTELRKELVDVMGDLNFNSNDMVGRAFEEMGLPCPPQNGRNKKGLYKVCKSSILFWKNNDIKIVSVYEEYKGLEKLIDTFVGIEKEQTGIWKYIFNNHIMSNYLLGVVRSLRISCTSMNLQNIPKHGKYAKDVRRQFGLPKGWKYAELDFSGFQLRIMAILSGDKNMRDIFCSDNDDLHLMTAIKLGILGKELTEEFTFEQALEVYNEPTHVLHKTIKALRKKSKGCYAEGTYIRTNKGEEKVEDCIPIGILDEVMPYVGDSLFLTRNGYEKPTHSICKEVDELFDIELENGVVMSVDEAHDLIIMRDNFEMKVKVNELRITDEFIKIY